MNFMQIKDDEVSLYRVTENWLTEHNKVIRAEVGYCFYGNTTMTIARHKGFLIKHMLLVQMSNAVIEEKNRICTVQVKPLKMMLHIKPDLTIEDIINGYVEGIPIHKYE